MNTPSRRHPNGRTAVRHVLVATVMGSPLVIVADLDVRHGGMLVRALTHLGAEAKLARSAVAVHTLLTEHACSALLVDLAMFGESTGYLERTIEHRRPSRIAVLASLRSGRDAAWARAMGFDAWFRKVVDVERVAAFVGASAPQSSSSTGRG